MKPASLGRDVNIKDTHKPEFLEKMDRVVPLAEQGSIAMTAGKREALDLSQPSTT